MTSDVVQQMTLKRGDDKLMGLQISFEIISTKPKNFCFQFTFYFARELDIFLVSFEVLLSVLNNLFESEVV